MKLVATILLSLVLPWVFSLEVISQNILGKNTSSLNTAVPFLMITPDCRAGAMGDAGAATSPDANSIQWNPAKLAFAEDEIGVSVSYTPWLRKLVRDFSLSYLSGYRRIDEVSTFGASFRYFSLGDLNITTPLGATVAQYRPNEFAADIAYARILSKRFSGGIALRYIHSNLSSGLLIGGLDTKPQSTFAVDVSTYYQNNDVSILNKDAAYAFGVNISNIGPRMYYTTPDYKNFLPINLRIGQRITMNMNEKHSIAITTDFNKLLTPTPPYYKKDSNGMAVRDPITGDYIVLAGKDPDRPVFNGMLTSFFDAPGVVVVDQNGDLVEVEKGSVLREEMREINYAIGLEYLIAKQIVFRAGYFGEHSTKGNRKYITLGTGIKYKVFGLDFAYLIPVNFDPSVTQRSPLKNTMRFTLLFAVR